MRREHTGLPVWLPSLAELWNVVPLLGRKYFREDNLWGLACQEFSGHIEISSKRIINSKLGWIWLAAATSRELFCPGFSNLRFEAVKHQTQARAEWEMICNDDGLSGSLKAYKYYFAKNQALIASRWPHHHIHMFMSPQSSQPSFKSSPMHWSPSGSPRFLDETTGMNACSFSTKSSNMFSQGGLEYDNKKKQMNATRRSVFLEL